MFNKDIAEKALIATLKIGVWSARKTDKIVLKEITDRHNVEEGQAGFSKLLISKTRLEQIKDAAQNARKLHNDLTLPWVDGGGRLLPSKDYPDYAKQMEAYKIQFYDAVDDFMNDYQSAINEGMNKLGEIADSKDYPSPDTIKSKYEFEYTFFPVPDNGDFRVTLSPDFISDLRSNFDKNQLDRFNKARQFIIEDVINLISNAIKRLRNKDKTSWFKAVTIDGLINYRTDHPMIELLEDDQLYAFLKEISETASLYTVQDLRGDELLRQEVSDIFYNILEKASKDASFIITPIDILSEELSDTDTLIDIISDIDNADLLNVDGTDVLRIEDQNGTITDIAVDIENVEESIANFTNNPEVNNIMNAFGLQYGQQPIATASTVYQETEPVINQEDYTFEGNGSSEYNNEDVTLEESLDSYPDLDIEHDINKEI